MKLGCGLLAWRKTSKRKATMRISQLIGESESKVACNVHFVRSLVWWLAVTSLIALFGCESYTPVPPPKVDPATLFYSTNTLHAGDLVEITFQYATNYNATQRIALDGTVNMNTVGPVAAAGKTVVELQQSLTNLYSSLAKGDVVTVNRMLNSIPVVYVAGAVIKPGEVNLDRPMTPLEAVMAGGGFDTLRAKLTDASVLRIENGQQHAYPVDLKRILRGEEPTPFYLKPFDIVYVPVKKFNY
jgi:protein involved in polysaccharide export with SLBB domain